MLRSLTPVLNKFSVAKMQNVQTTKWLMILQGHVATRQAVPNVMIPWKPNGTDSKELQAMRFPYLVSQRTAVVLAPLGGFMELIRQ